MKNVKLSHTLQTYLGMVTDNGKPKQRLCTALPSYLLNSERMLVQTRGPSTLSDEQLVSLFTACLLENRLPEFQDSLFHAADAKKFKSNVHACCDPGVNLDFMKGNIRALTRLDLEQAAAIVIAAILNDPSIPNSKDVVSALVNEFQTPLLTQSCMWLDTHQWSLAESIEALKLSRLIDLWRRMYSKAHHTTESAELELLTTCQDWAALLPLLLRVRRCSPRTRCLFIPQWVFDSAGIAPPAEYAAVTKDIARITPGHEPLLPVGKKSESYIILGRKAFRALQRRILHYHEFWVPEVRLRKAITDFESNVIYSAAYIQSQVLPSRHTLVVAHYFFALQRRLQRKVVSDMHWTRFLEKGEGATLLQNTPDIQTTFEQRLSEFSGQQGVPVSGDVLAQIDHCCLLMENYVAVYGNGDRNNLVFVQGKRGGSGRGAVDEYNLLCDVLRTLVKAAKEQRLEYPDTVRKFLAKDIMAWNKSFGDDAFAGGVVPGWETWLIERRNAGIVKRQEDVKIG